MYNQFLFKETNIVSTDTLVWPYGACIEGDWITKHPKQINTVFVIILFLKWGSFISIVSLDQQDQTFRYGS